LAVIFFAAAVGNLDDFCTRLTTNELQMPASDKKVKVNCAILHWSIGGVLISLSKAVSP